MGNSVRRRFALGGLFIALIRAYQKFVSPLFPPSCRFTPSCSQYTIEAIYEYGLFRGALMGSWRVLRCNPFSKGGRDPVK